MYVSGDRARNVSDDALRRLPRETAIQGDVITPCENASKLKPAQAGCVGLVTNKIIFTARDFIYIKVIFVMLNIAVSIKIREI